MIGYDAVEPARLTIASAPPRDPERGFPAPFAIRWPRRVSPGLQLLVRERRGPRASSVFDPADHVAVATPSPRQRPAAPLPAAGHSPELIENSKRFDSFRLFEIGREITRTRRIAGRDSTPGRRHFPPGMMARRELFEASASPNVCLPGAELIPCAPRAFEHPARGCRSALARPARRSPIRAASRYRRRPRAILYLNLETILGASDTARRIRRPAATLERLRPLRDRRLAEAGRPTCSKSC